LLPPPISGITAASEENKGYNNNQNSKLCVGGRCLLTWARVTHVSSLGIYVVVNVDILILPAGM
jgi:hypothetical protein